jgi:CTD small phosphatase-like protein 2
MSQALPQLRPKLTKAKRPRQKRFNKGANTTQELKQARDFALDEKPAQTLNLETVLVMEEKLSVMLEAHRANSELYPIAQDYWVQGTDTSLHGVVGLCADPSNRKALRKLLILEAAGVMLVCSLDPSYPSMRNLLYYMHQNFLSFTEFVLKRVPEEDRHNVWTQSLMSVVNNKMATKLKRQDSLGRVKQYNEVLINVIKSLVMQVQATAPKRPPVCAAVMHVLRQIDHLTVAEARELLSKTTVHYSPEAVEHTQVEVMPAPYLPDVAEGVYTMVLDLDETLIHYFEGEAEGFFLVRPGCDTFLKELSKHYEVVIFTAALQDVSSIQYADWVLDQIDSERVISHRLYRQHTMQTGAVCIKDLSRLGRDLSRVIIVDNVADNFQRQPDNGIFIRSWFDDMSDCALNELLPLLKGN